MMFGPLKRVTELTEEATRVMEATVDMVDTVDTEAMEATEDMVVKLP